MHPKIRIPFNGKAKITFQFGEDPEWYTRVFGYPHNGVDWGMKPGRATLACAKGTLIFADSVPDADGMGIIMRHEWGTSLYWHLNEITAKNLQSVNKGDMIGVSGATGFVTGPHLHFGIKIFKIKNPKMRNWLNPLDYLEKTIIPPAVQLIEPKYYLVKLGDNLWKIAEKFYGYGGHWTKIYNANREKIKHPGLIYPLQRLLIP